MASYMGDEVNHPVMDELVSSVMDKDLGARVFVQFSSIYNREIAEQSALELPELTALARLGGSVQKVGSFANMWLDSSESEDQSKVKELLPKLEEAVARFREVLRNPELKQKIVAYRDYKVKRDKETELFWQSRTKQNQAMYCGLFVGTIVGCALTYAATSFFSFSNSTVVEL